MLSRFVHLFNASWYLNSLKLSPEKLSVWNGNTLQSYSSYNVSYPIMSHTSNIYNGSALENAICLMKGQTGWRDFIETIKRSVVLCECWKDSQCTWKRAHYIPHVAHISSSTMVEIKRKSIQIWPTYVFVMPHKNCLAVNSYKDRWKGGSPHCAITVSELLVTPRSATHEAHATELWFLSNWMGYLSWGLEGCGCKTQRGSNRQYHSFIQVLFWCCIVTGTAKMKKCNKLIWYILKCSSKL